MRFCEFINVNYLHTYWMLWSKLTKPEHGYFLINKDPRFTGASVFSLNVFVYIFCCARFPFPFEVCTLVLSAATSSSRRRPSMNTVTPRFKFLSVFRGFFLTSILAPRGELGPQGWTWPPGVNLPPRGELAPRGEICPLGGMFTPSSPLPRGEHSIV
jgi:hypothetical protein